MLHMTVQQLGQIYQSGPVELHNGHMLTCPHALLKLSAVAPADGVTCDPALARLQLTVRSARFSCVLRQCWCSHAQP